MTIACASPEAHLPFSQSDECALCVALESGRVNERHRILNAVSTATLKVRQDEAGYHLDVPLREVLTIIKGGAA
jgi:hypothetical protein